jgi:hypothetical protein
MPLGYNSAFVNDGNMVTINALIPEWLFKKFIENHRKDINEDRIVLTLEEYIGYHLIGYGNLLETWYQDTRFSKDRNDQNYPNLTYNNENNFKIKDDVEFKERLRKVLLDFDIESIEFPNPHYVGALLWERYMDKEEAPHIASNEIRNYYTELFAARREKGLLK